MIPDLVKVRQEISAPEVPDPISKLHMGLSKFSGKIRPGQKVAVAIGSRGISNPGEIVKAVVDWVKAERGKPFIVPAMGSHGASTSAGQKKVLAELGICEERMGCKVLSEIDAQKIGETPGLNIFTDRFALKADQIILINRIKPHTSFHGEYESGLCKMLAIGLGKRKGAEEIHKRGPEYLAMRIPKAAEYLLKKLPVLLGVAILENYRERIAEIEVIAGRDFLKREPALLKKAYQLFPRLPFDELEVLVVDQIGKDKSGTGMDTNVIGRLDLRGLPETGRPRIRRIVVLGLSPKTAGSAYGIGLADITTRKVVRKMDWNAMRENALASTFVERVRVPVWFDSDCEAIEAAIKTSWCPEISKLRLCRIKSTLELEEFWITRNLLQKSHAPLKVIQKNASLKFDRHGNI